MKYVKRKKFSFSFQFTIYCIFPFNFILAGKCVDVKPDEALDVCRAIGFNRTAFPNYVGDLRATKAIEPVMTINTIQMSTNCYKHATLFACAAYLPKCSGTNVVPSHTIPPCKSLCSSK